ncbi:MAG: enoyl-CoA hydratase/isomerase family protein [Gammaproteobacteria bacterium]|nr:enoyl-CoA hydratase/isomerase family protein [Gammaproteobacteria bacterium]
MSSSQATQPSGIPSLTLRDGRATVCLNRPAQHNRLEPADLEALISIFDQADTDDSIRVLVLTATGRSFSSGFHLGALAERSQSGSSNHDANAFERTVDRLESLRVPTIAALNGGVYGGATDLALACDFRLGVQDMRMFMPAARLGIVYYQSGLRRYVSRLGLNNAKKLFLTAQPAQAEELLRMGYLDEVLPADGLMTRVDELAAQLAGNAPLAVAAIKKSLNDLAAGRLDPAEHEAARRLCAASEDHKEGLRAWAEKRAPVFEGR